MGTFKLHLIIHFFTKKTPSSYTILFIYVDDIVLAGNPISEFSEIKSTLDVAFGIKDLGVLKFFLGLEAAHSSQGIYLCQRQYCLDLLSDSGHLGNKPVRHLWNLGLIFTKMIVLHILMFPVIAD